MILITRAIEGDLRHAGGLGFLGNAFTDQLGSFYVATMLNAATHFFLERRRRGKHFAACLVDDLRVDMLRRAMHTQPTDIETHDTPADTASTAQSFLFVAHHV